jgi:DNA-directed RNA polymerase I subunit RPA1
LLSSLVAYYTRGQPPLTLESGCKVPVDYWGRGSDEGKFVFHKGELVAGCLDKAQFGKFGLVHAVQVRGICGRAGGWVGGWASGLVSEKLKV